MLMSSTKGAAALCTLLLVDRGEPVRRVSVGFVRSQLSLMPTFSDSLIAALYRDL
jgi:hypothetical protein